MSAAQDIAITDEVEDGERLLAVVRDGPGDVMLVGLGLPRHVGAAAFRELRRSSSACQILVHNYEWQRAFAHEACWFGALGYVSHECTLSALGNAVRNVAEGRPFITRPLGAEPAEAVCFRGTVLAHAASSAREMRVARMVAIGLDVSRIAFQLGIGVHEAAACKWRIAGKVDVTGTGELVQYAVRQVSRAWSGMAVGGSVAI